MLTIKDLDKPHFKVTVHYVHAPIPKEEKTFSGPQNRPSEKIYEQRIEEIDLQRIIGAVNAPPDFILQPRSYSGLPLSKEDIADIEKGPL